MPRTKYRLRWLALFVTSSLATSATAQERPVLTLAEARAMLLERSDELAIQGYTVEQAALVEDAAKTALVPTLTLNMDYTFRDREIEFAQGNVYAPLGPYLDSVFNNDPALQDFFDNNPDAVDVRDLAAIEPEPAVVQFRHDYRAILTLSQRLFDLPALELLDLAETQYEQAVNARRQVELSLMAGLNTLYFETETQRRSIEVTERNLEVEQQAYDRAVAAFEEEVGNRFEVTRAEVRLRAAQRQVVVATTAYAVSLEALANYLNAPSANFDVVQPRGLAQPGSEEEVVQRALQSRPEIEGRDLAIQQAEQRLDETRAGWYPTLFANAQATVVRESIFSGDPLSWTLGLSLVWEIWDGGVRLAQRDTRRLTLSQEEVRREQIVRDIASEVRRAWLQVESQNRVVESARDEVDLSIENLDLTQESQLLGVATQLDVQTAQSQLFLNELTLVRAEVRQQALVYELYRLAGEDPSE